ncbi:MAG: glycogen/starch synthase [Acidobacteriota bacterium]
MKIVFATAEVSPIAKTGGLGDVCGSLPKALVELGHEVVVFMPFYRQARDWFGRSGQPVERLGETLIWWNGWSARAEYLRSTLPGTGIPLIMVANDYFFDRDQIYSGNASGGDDGLERFTFFCRALIRGCELFGIAPDILHCHDWHTALLPVYLHSGLRDTQVFQKTRSIYTIHNLNYQGVTPSDRFGSLGLHSRYWAPDALEHYGEINPMKAGIMFADHVTTVSPHYANEVMTSEYGAGLDGILRSLGPRFTGILNGIDTDEWDPATDVLLEANFTIDKLHGKAVSKRMLAKEAGFKNKARTPLIGVVSRLVHQKGFQLLVPILDRLLLAGAQVVILGSGEYQYEEAFTNIAARHKDHCRAWIGFDNALAHRIYAGCDLLLIPSLYEPCGLNQMYALRYGTLPVVRLTGGLVDTVKPFDGTNRDSGNGFGFVSAGSEELYFATWIGMLNYKDSRLWKELQRNAMAADFSWKRSAREYVKVYEGNRS